jgi:hypothetical protein
MRRRLKSRNCAHYADAVARVSGFDWQLIFSERGAYARIFHFTIRAGRISLFNILANIIFAGDISITTRRERESR